MQAMTFSAPVCCASASRLPTPTTPSPRASASPWVTPAATRRPVKEPGPSPYAMPSICESSRRASASNSSTMPRIFSACRWSAGSLLSYTASPRLAATEHESVEVSIASRFTRRILADRALDERLRLQPSFRYSSKQAPGGNNAEIPDLPRAGAVADRRSRAGCLPDSPDHHGRGVSPRRRRRADRPPYGDRDGKGAEAARHHREPARRSGHGRKRLRRQREARRLYAADGAVVDLGHPGGGAAPGPRAALRAVAVRAYRSRVRRSRRPGRAQRGAVE